MASLLKREAGLWVWFVPICCGTGTFRCSPVRSTLTDFTYTLGFKGLFLTGADIMSLVFPSHLSGHSVTCFTTSVIFTLDSLFLFLLCSRIMLYCTSIYYTHNMNGDFKKPKQMLNRYPKLRMKTFQHCLLALGGVVPIAEKRRGIT